MSRLEFTAETKRQASKRSGGICECHLCPTLKRPQGCGMPLGIGNQFYEHITQDAIKQDNDLSNCAKLCKTCWSEKTYGTDLPVIAKSKRQRDQAWGIKSRRGPRLRSRNTFQRG
jgi:5-methylcytosine-specific restriction enzyme A